MANRDLVVIGASAGGLGALRRIVSELQPDLPASVLITQHLSPERPSLLHQILARAGSFPVTQAVQGQRLEHGHAYTAPPDRHFMVEGDHIDLSDGPRQNGVRPAIDALFCSAAARGRATVGVILSGTLDDGMFGLHLIKQAGGIAVVQDPLDAEYAEMPAAALDSVAVDYVLPGAEIGALLQRLTAESLVDEPSAPTQAAQPPAGPFFICPDCGGPLRELSSAGVQHYRCELGHEYAPKALLSAMGVDTARALWSALRLHHDQVRVYQRMIERRQQVGRDGLSERLTARIAELQRYESLLRGLISGSPVQRPAAEGKQ